MATGFLNFKTKHAVAGSSKLKATVAGHIVNIRLTADADNGIIVKKGDYEKAEVYKEAAASAEFRGKVIDKAANGNWYVEVTAVNEDYFVLQVPMIYEEYTTQMQHESNFFNQKDDIVRAYELYVGDIFELSPEGFTEEVTKGDTVAVDSATRKLKKSA